MPNGADVIGFFEKNGLRHGEFPLPKSCTVFNVSWNCDATILSVHFSAENPSEHSIQLWVVSNYKWQLKKSWTSSDKFYGFQWDPVMPLTLYIFAPTNGFKYELKWKIHQSRGVSSDDLSYASIIDGSILKVTPFREMVVPPPISAFELHVSGNISDVMFSNSIQDFNSLAVITENSQVYVFDTTGNADESIVKITGAGGNGFIPKCTTLKLLKTFKLQESNGKELYNWCWFTPKAAMACQGQLIYIFDMENGALRETLICEEDVVDIIAMESSNVAVVLSDGNMLKISDLFELTPYEGVEPLPRRCSNIQIVENQVIGKPNF